MAAENKGDDPARHILVGTCEAVHRCLNARFLEDLPRNACRWGFV
ncbi:hypothetical protein C8D89_10594 [Actinomycetospora cinnamomea]|uniref:Uncharacterized protein n=1 Tax=Actinomycetospora cinnamomea TaxID=663609 RepID=A0A2U1FCX6_9PSEU|nr:hypothetical protein C8D89_10594 [Actinomycetospora cinnamomea]